MTPTGGRQAVAAPGVREVARRLEEEWGTPRKPRLDPLDELVLTILSQNTTDTNRDRAWEALRERWPDWEAVRGAPREEMEETIRPAGLAVAKARAIHEALERLAEERGAPRLDHLRGMTPEEALRYLAGFRGVGVKTAACVLCFSLGWPVLPVDTHVHRVATRLGWVPEGATAGRAHDLLHEKVPPELRYALHVRLIAHGRAVCTARRPACDRCTLESLCPRIGVEES